MKKSIIILSSLILVLCFIFVSCSTNEPETDKTSSSTEDSSGLEGNNVEYGFEEETVTDDKGKTVTKADGKPETTSVQVIYKKNNKGKYVAQLVDDKGEPVTKKNGKEETVKSDYADELNGDSKKTTKKKDDNKNSSTSNNNNSNNTLPTPTTNEKTTTASTDNTNISVTKDNETTAFNGNQKVPKTTDKGKEVYFSNEDYQRIAAMLEVPYLYLSSYENEDGVPINIATYTAVWMAQHNGESAALYPSSPVVLNLFKYYGQTVVNFKTKCNDVDGAPIKYNKSDDTFTVNKYNDKVQSVKITKVEDMGNDNFYKVTGDVSGAGKIKNVVAIVQKNKLEPTLGFSIKALKWS